MALYVARGRAVRIPGNLPSGAPRHAQEGQEVTSYFSNEREIQGLINDGFLVRHDPFINERADGAVRLGDVPKLGEPAALSDQERVESQRRMANNPDPWGLDPAGINGLTLEQLNLLVLERDKTIKPFETREEAIAQLTRDYKAPGTKAKK